MADRPDDVTEEVSSSQGQQTHEVGESSRPPQTEDEIFRTQLVTAVTMFTQVMQNPRFMAFLQPLPPSQSIGNKKSEPAKAQPQVIHTAVSMETPVHLPETMQSPNPVHNAQEQVAETPVLQAVPVQPATFQQPLVDKNGNGTLELEELKDCFRELQVSFTDEEVKDLYAESDMNANSGIDFKEFIVLLALVYLLSSPNDQGTVPSSLHHKSRLGFTQLEKSFDKIADAFVFFDKDCDGYVSKSEIVEAIGQASPGSRNADRIGLKRFEEMDWDKNGLITFKEFLFAFTNWVGVKDEEEYSSD
ncbi:hypothetical protein L7F22_006715 [Adiantum nelumboides]|nr:hypothetical protein [Adiantum nelumboides]